MRCRDFEGGTVRALRLSPSPLNGERAGVRGEAGRPSSKYAITSSHSLNDLATGKILSLCLALFCATAGAHQLSDSFLVLQLTNAQIIGHWDIAVKDLLHAKG